MCSDPRKASPEELIRAWEGRMGVRDEGIFVHNCTGKDCWCRDRCPRCGAPATHAHVVGPGIRVTTCECGAFFYPKRDGLPPRDGPGPAVPLVLCPDRPGDPPRGGASVLARYGTANDQFDGSIGKAMAAWIERWAQRDRIAEEVRRENGEIRARRARWIEACETWVGAWFWVTMAVLTFCVTYVIARLAR